MLSQYSVPTVATDFESNSQIDITAAVTSGIYVVTVVVVLIITTAAVSL